LVTRLMGKRVPEGQGEKFPKPQQKTKLSPSKKNPCVMGQCCGRDQKKKNQKQSEKRRKTGRVEKLKRKMLRRYPSLYRIGQKREGGQNRMATNFNPGPKKGQ